MFPSSIRIFALCAAAILTCTHHVFAQQPVILPLGDSITYGTNSQSSDAPGGGYRTELYNQLLAAGISFRFVGSSALNPSATLTEAGANFTSHEGHPGYRIEQIDGNLEANALTGSNNGGYWITGGGGTGRSAINPSMVLLNIGTNNMDGSSAAQVYAKLETLLNHLKTLLPNAHIFVSSLTPRTDIPFYDGVEQQYNALIAANLSSFGPNFHFVDLRTGFPSDGLGPDGLHPNLVGYNWMGVQWATAILAHLAGTGGGGGGNGGSGGGGISVINGGFETPAVADFDYSPSGAGWTFTGIAGIQRNGGSYSYGAPPAPEGVQTALVQSYAGSVGSLSQTVSFTPGSYVITFRAARRFGAVQPVKVSVGGVEVGTYTPSSDNYEQISTPAFPITNAGNQVVTFAATDATGDKTTFIDQVSISASGGGGGSAPTAPTGLSATAGNGQVTLNWTASGGAQSYRIYRSTTSGGQSGTPIASGITGTTYTDAGLTNGTTYYYKVAAVNTSGTSALSNEASATPSSGGGGGGGTISVTNGSFETPTITDFSYNPSGSGWSFTNYAGIQRNGGSYSYGAPTAPDGVQTALLQGYANTLGTMSQTVSFTPGNYVISFRAARRLGTAQPVKVSVGGSDVGTYTPVSNTYELITSAPFSIMTAGNYVVTFAATDGGGDKTTFIDVVTIGATGGGGGGGDGAPTTPTGLSASAGNAQVVLTWSPSSGAATYNIYRATTSGGQSGTPVASDITGATYTDTGLTNGTTYYYKVAAVNTSGTSALSNEASATPSSGGGGGGGGGTVSVTNGSFETPAIADFSYNPPGSGWSFTNFAGIQRNGGSYSYGAPTAPDGVQTALVQGYANTLGTMSQTVSFTPGSYVITFRAARRLGTVQPVKVSVGGVEVGTYTPSSNNYEQITTSAFPITNAGNHVVTFAATAATDDKTTFIDQVSISASGGGGGSAPAAPTGLSATAGNGQVTLNWTASGGAESYRILRGTSSGGQSGTPIASDITGTTYTDTGLTNGTTYYYKVAAVNTSGTSALSTEASATPSSGGGGGGGTISVTNGSFETPSITDFSYSPPGSGWSFTNYGGIQRNGGSYSYGAPTAPDGVQTALLQGYANTLGTMSQTVSFTPGNYVISFRAARRLGTAQPVKVSVGGSDVGTYTPVSNTYELITSSPFSITTAGNYVVTFAATDGSADKTTFIDVVTIGAAGGGNPPGGLTAESGNARVVLSWSSIPGAASYTISRSLSPAGGNPTVVATGVSGLSFTDLGLTNGNSYYYTVRAVDSQGAPGNSLTASVVPTFVGDIDLTGYTLTFSEEFDNLSVTTNTPKAASTWYYRPPYGGAGNYSASTWDIAALSVENGILKNRAWIGEQPGTWGTYWYSGNLSSVDESGAGFSQLYGYFEARVRMPASGRGAWPSFWLVSTKGIPAVSPTPSKVSEIDIFEWYGVTNTPGNYQALIQQASHNWNENGSENQTTADYLHSPLTNMPGGAYPWEDYHIYGCRIDPQHITWYIDGVQTNQIETPTEYLTSPYYIMVAYALGGGWPLDGMVDGSTMCVDWVRVYSLPPE